jgi:hypothetical protein
MKEIVVSSFPAGVAKFTLDLPAGFGEDWYESIAGRFWDIHQH